MDNIDLYKHYINEFKFRLLYNILSLFICMYLYHNYLEVLIIFKVWPIILYLKYKFLILNIFELLYINFYIVSFMSVLTIIPHFLFHFKSYMKPSLYNYQRIAWSLICTIYYKSLIYSNTIYYIIVIPLINYCLAETFLKKKLYGILNISIELQLSLYLDWCIQLNYILNYIILSTLLIVNGIQYFIPINIIYLYYKQNKKIILISLLTIFFIILPSESFLQPFIFSVLLLTVDVIFIYINYKYSLFYKWVL